jgi:hypothetical protein
VADATSGSPAAGFDVGAVIRQVHFAWRPEGTGAFTAGHVTHAVRADEKGSVELTPAQPSRKGEQGKRGAALTLETVAVERGAQAASLGAPTIEADGSSLAIRRGAVVETLTNGDEGVEQSWAFAAPPSGEGDLFLRVRTSGETYAGSTSRGLHFIDEATKLGFCYGPATWIDATGQRTKVSVAYDHGALVLTVPAAVVAASAYPAVLDPTIGPELGIDTPQRAGAPGDQRAPAIAFDGTNYLVVWEDERSGRAVFAARVSKAGTVLDPAGIPIAEEKASSEPFKPRVAYDGTNYLVTWASPDAAVVRATRVARSGSVLDAPPITISGSGYSPAIAFDGTNYLVVFVDAGLNAIMGNRVSKAGTVLDGASGFQVGELTPLDIQREPAVAFNGTSYLVVWTDTRHGGEDIFGHRIGTNGARLDSLNDTAIAIGTNLQFGPAVASDGQNWLVVFMEFSGVASHIMAARVDSLGRAFAEFPVTSDPNGEETPAVAFDGTNYLVVWTDSRDSATRNLDVYGARISKGGVSLDGAGFPISNNVPSEANPAVAFDGTNYLVAWEDSRNPDQDIFARRVSKSATVLDPAQTLVSGIVANAETEPSVAFDGTNYFVVWQDNLGARTEIIGFLVKPNGTVVSGLSITGGLEAGHFRPRVVFGGTNYLVVWEDDRGASISGLDIFGARVTKAGLVLEPDGFPISQAPNDQVSPAVAASGGNFLVVWQDLRGGTDYDIYGARVTGAGVVLDPAGIPISTAIRDQAQPAVAAAGSTFLVAWADWRDFTGFADIRGARVGSNGVLLDGPADSGGVVLTDAVDDQLSPAVASSGSSFLVVWEDWRNGTSSDIRGTRVTTLGAPLDLAGLQISVAPDDQNRPTALWDGARFVVAWEDHRSGTSADIFATTVSKQGVVQNTAGFIISNGATDELAPALAASAAGQLICVYQSFVTSMDIVRARMRLVTFP